MRGFALTTPSILRVDLGEKSFDRWHRTNNGKRAQLNSGYQPPAC
jgi:hypothetical protein